MKNKSSIIWAALLCVVIFSFHPVNVKAYIFAEETKDAVSYTFNNILTEETLAFNWSPQTESIEHPILRVLNQVEQPISIRVIKNSNPSVVSFKVTKNHSWDDEGKSFHQRRLRLTCQKPGVSSITIKVTDGKKKRTINFNVCVVKYRNPFQKIQVGKKDLTSCFNWRKLKKYYWQRSFDFFAEYYYETKKDIKGKLKLKLKAGWKLYDLQLFMENSKEDYDYEMKDNEIHNGDYVEFDHRLCPNLMFVLEHKRTGAKFFYELLYGELDDYD